MLAIRATTGFDPTDEPCATRAKPDSPIPSAATNTTKRRFCLATSAATQSPSASPSTMFRLRLRITPVSATANIAHPSSLCRAGPQRMRARAKAATMYTVVSPGGRTLKKPVSSGVSVEATSLRAIRKMCVDGPTITWRTWSITTSTTPAETSVNTRLRPLMSAASAGQKAA